MATCNGCGAKFEWGRCDGQWVPLEPQATHDGMDRTYVDENGELRADHRDRHPGGGSVNVARLDRKVKSQDVPEEEKTSRMAAMAASIIKGGQRGRG